MNVVVYYPPSPGCENSAEIVARALSSWRSPQPVNVVLVQAHHELPEHVLLKEMKLDFEVDCVIFCERVIVHPALLSAKHRILIPNPEWLDPTTQARAQTCTQVWHKSQFSLQRLAPVFPDAKHAFLGFTSSDTGQRVQSYESFLHLRGKLLTRRNTNSILALWKVRPELPPLYMHFYEQAQGGIDYPGWLSDHNVHVRMGWLARQEYLELAGQHGMHLCTSEVEGFGHYINEARAMGAMVITTDAAPMNELVDTCSGILVRPSKTVPMNFGFRHLIAPEDLAVAIDQVMRLSLEERQALGAAARKRFVEEDNKFHQRAHQLFEQWVQPG